MTNIPTVHQYDYRTRALREQADATNRLAKAQERIAAAQERQADAAELQALAAAASIPESDHGASGILSWTMEHASGLRDLVSDAVVKIAER